MPVVKSIDTVISLVGSAGYTQIKKMSGNKIAVLTEEISEISKHLKVNKKDFSSNRGLMTKVGRRKRLLIYLSRTNLLGYRALIEKLGLRK